MTTQNKSPQAQDGFSTTQTGYKTSYTAIRKARRFALQGIYEWLMTDDRFAKMGEKDWLGNTPDVITVRTRATNAMHTVHLGYYHELMRNIPAQIDELTALIASTLDRPIKRLDTIEYTALLIGAYELIHSRHIPFKVVIDEAILLNTHFGATDGFKLINVVMDGLAKQIRADEIAGKQAPKAKALPNLG